MLRLLGLFGFLMVIVGCQVSPTRYDSISEGQWDGRILIKDKKQNKSYIVSVDINAVKDEKIRLDVTAALGHPVATLVVDGDKTQYILFEKKAYYEGRTQPKVLAPILSLPMDPRVLNHILFDREFRGSGWSCRRDEDDFLKSCENEKMDLEIDWVERKGRRKTVKIEHPRASLQLNLNTFQPKVVEKRDLFSLTKPPGFNAYKVR